MSHHFADRDNTRAARWRSRRRRRRGFAPHAARRRSGPGLPAAHHSACPLVGQAPQRIRIRHLAGRAVARKAFTLIELLVAITILAIIAMIAWRGLDSLAATRARLDPEADDARALLTTYGQLERDAAQIASPALFAMRTRPVLATSTDSGTALQLIRIASPQPDGATALQTVTYQVVDGMLVRRALPPTRRNNESACDLAPEAIDSARLMSGVTGFQVRYWQSNVGWIAPEQESAAPPPGVVQAPGIALPPPPGLEVRITRNGREYRRVLLVG